MYKHRSHKQEWQWTVRKMFISVLDLQWFLRMWMHQCLYCTSPKRASWRYCWPALGHKCPSLLTDGRTKMNEQREDHAALRPLRKEQMERNRRAKMINRNLQIKTTICVTFLPPWFPSTSCFCVFFRPDPASSCHHIHLFSIYMNASQFHLLSPRSSSMLTSSSFPVLGPLLLFWTVFDCLVCSPFIIPCLNLYLASGFFFFSCSFGNLT